jgi:hypothetical protein
MKFVNATRVDRRPPGDSTDSPYGRKVEKSPSPPALPTPYSPNGDLKLLLASLKPEPKGRLESKLIKASMMNSEEAIKKETEDILAVLRKLHK